MKKKIGGVHTGPQNTIKKTFLGPNTNDDVPRVQEGPKWARIEGVGPMDNGGAHFGPKKYFYGALGPIKSPPNYPKTTILSLKMRETVPRLLGLPGLSQLDQSRSYCSYGPVSYTHLTLPTICSV